jgi:hypothetical protein
VRKKSKLVFSDVGRGLGVITAAALVAPLMVAAAPAAVARAGTAPAEAVAAQSVAAMPLAGRNTGAPLSTVQDRSELAGWLGLSAGTGVVIIVSRRRRRVATA